MDFLTDLWLPILVSAAVVFFLSFLLHMVIPIHKGDFKQIPNEEEFVQTMQSTPAGLYMFPWGTPQTMNSPEFKEKQQRGPNGTLSIFPGPVNMGSNLIRTFAMYLVMGVLIAYLGWHALIPGSDFASVFRITGAAAFCCHALGWIPMMIWYRCCTFWPNMIDALVYTAATGAVFAVMWPGI